MKKRSIALIIFLATIVLSGCGRENEKVLNENISSEEVTETKYILNTQKKESVIEKCIRDSNVCSVTPLGKGILAIIIENKDNIITCDFVDMKSDRIVAKVSELGFDRNMTIEGYDKGCTIYTSAGQVYVLDKEYKVQDKIDASKYISYSEQRKYVVSPSAQKIISCEEKEDKVFQEIVSMDYDGKKRRVLRKIYNPNKNHNELNQIVEIKLARNEKSIFINGLYYEHVRSGEKSKVCIGTINLEDGSSNIYKDQLSYFTVFENKAVYYDGMADFQEKSSGKIKLIYDDNKVEDIKFNEKWKSQEIFFSDSGNYILTYGDDEIGATKTIISIYNIKTKEKVGDIEFQNKLYDIAVCEKKKIVYGFYYGDDGETKVEIGKY